MRTPEEILARIKDVTPHDMFGFRRDVLMGYLDFEHVKPFLKPEAVPAQWVADQNSTEAIIQETKSYMELAWGKVRDHRGLSAGRSVQKMTEFCWLLGEDKLIEQIEKSDYPQYGAPILKLICEKFGFPIPDDEDLKLMMQGLRCRACTDGSNSGCGK